MAGGQSNRRGARSSKSATVEQPAYSEGEGFAAGQRAPSSKYRTIDGSIVDELPEGEGGWEIVVKGDVVNPQTARELEEGGVTHTLANENSPGDASHSES